MGNENYFLVPDYFWPMDMQSEPDTTLDQSPDLTLPEQAPAEGEGNGTESVDQNVPEEQGGTPETTEQDTTTTDQGGTPETTEQDTTTTDQGGANESTETTNTTESSDTSEQNILAGHNVSSYILVADNDKTDPAADPAAVSDPATAGSDPATVTTDEKANNGQGNESGNTDSTVTDPNTGGADNNGQGNGPETNNGQGNGPETNNGQGNGPAAPGADTSTDSGIGTNPTEDTDLGDLLDVLDHGNLVDLDNVLDQFATDGAIDSSLPDDLEDLNSNLDIKKPGWYGTWGFSVWDGLFPVGSGYYTRSEGEPDELELYIPLSSVAHHYDGITEISMRIKKLGPQHIMCSGVSTGAYIGVAAGAGIAMLSVGAYTFKRKRPFILGKGK
jgi:hypothetical protein